MINTGQIYPSYHPNAGEPIMKIEESDIKFWEKEWYELSINEKADFCSLMEMPFLNGMNENMIANCFESYRLKFIYNIQNK